MLKLKGKYFKKIICLMMICLLLTVSFSIGNVFAECASDPAPMIHPQSPNGKTILFDNSHAQTAGAADWVIDGAFSDYANALAQAGYEVRELRKENPITVSDLSDADLFVIPEANIPFKVEEQTAIVSYVQNGGAVFFISDHYNADRNKNRWDASEVFNGYRRGAYTDPTLGMNAGEKNSSAMQNVVSNDWLSENFGVRFRYNALADINTSNLVSPSQCFQITQGISTLAMHAGSTIAILNPQVAMGVAYLPENLPVTAKWPHAADQGIYNGGGIAEGAYAAIAKKGLGKAAFLGDTSLVEDATPKYRKEENGDNKVTYDGFLEANDRAFLLNLTNWLTEDEPYTSFASQGVALSPMTSLFNFEIPANSTEPQPEPWANPSGQYLWYDTSTFAQGSYGYKENGGGIIDPQTEPDATISLPRTIYNNTLLPVTITLCNLTPNITLTGYKLGAYKDGGLQVASFSEDPGNVGANYGYSDPFSMTADSSGVATKTLWMRVQPGTVGNVNFRIKKGSNKIVTIQKPVQNPVIHSNLTYDFSIPEPIHKGYFSVFIVRVEGLTPGQTMAQLKVGSYLPGGEQISQFSFDGETWNTNYGYSDIFSVVADSKGVAEKVVYCKFKKSITERSAFLRIKRGNSAVYTTTINLY